jgi:hypothetical protein
LKVEFIGPGTRVAGMALNLRGAGHALSVYDVCKESAQPLVDVGVTLAATVAVAARGSRSPMQRRNKRAGVSIQVSAEDVQKTLSRG